MSKIINIYSKGEYPANVLSNFYPNSFEIDGVACASMEGFLQSLKFKNKEKQRKICALVGIEAKNAGRKKWLWKITGNVYWQGKRIKRDGKDFKNLLVKGYRELLKNPTFYKALEDSYGCTYTHSIGKNDARKTILTEKEFIWLLNQMRMETLAEVADKGGRDGAI